MAKRRMTQLRIELTDKDRNKSYRVINEKRLSELQTAFTNAGADLFKMLIEESEPYKQIKLLHED